MNKLRETLAVFDEGGLWALKYGPGIVPVKVRRSAFEAAIHEDAQHPHEDLFALIDQHKWHWSQAPGQYFSLS